MRSVRRRGLPDTSVIGVLERVRSRWRLRSVMLAIAAGGALLAATSIVLTVFSLTAAAFVNPLAIAVGAAAAAALTWRTWPLSLSGAARLVEANRSLDNLLVTAAELEERPRPVRAEIGDEITRLAAARVRDADWGRAVPIGQPIAVAIAVSIGCGLLVLTDTTALLNRPSIAAPGGAVTPADGGVLTVRIAPPSYTRWRVAVFENPVQVTAIAGSEIRIASGSRVLRAWRATESASLELRISDTDSPRFLSVIVVPDAPPSVRIHTPGRDTALAQPRGSVAIGVDGRDDLRLTSLTVKFTKASRGGENVTFAEGEVPIAIERTSDRQWAGRGEWSLDGLGLTDGDVLVYRAIARDSDPAGEPVYSDAYLIEIGRTAEIASAGFALPSEDRKYAISQQMVIYKTEQLLASAGKGLPGRSLGEGWLEQTRLIGIEQRMVRAEVVFLSGGEVEDEVEEAAHSHELAEGRLENQGRAEMVRAINLMSRAEAQLNDGRADEALVLERQALASLERALDRRRYFLRTLPGRLRIDVSRRLTGERREARSWLRARSDASAPPSLEQQRAVMRELADAVDGRGAAGAALAAHVAAIDPKSAQLQQAAVAIASASSDEERRETARAAMRAVTSHALNTLPSSTPVCLDVDPLAGRLADVLTREGRPPK